MRKKSTPKLQKLYCDRIWSQLVRAPGVCARCGDRRGPFQAAHIVRRRFAHTRTDLENGWCLDADCHRIVDTNASAFVDLVERTIGVEKLRALEDKALRRDKFNWFSEHERLKALVKGERVPFHVEPSGEGTFSVIREGE